MKKYEIRKSGIEIPWKNRMAIKEGITMTEDNNLESELIASFDSVEDAKEELEKYRSSISKFSSHGMTYYLVEEYYVEENVYDEDGEWIEGGGDIWGFSKISIELVEKPSYETLKTFDNMKDAEDAYNSYEGENEVYLSF